jgi:hypothetical protein
MKPQQRELWPEEARKLPGTVLQYLTPEEIILCETMPAGLDCAKMLAWLARHPKAIGFFIAETMAILTETPFALVQAEEVLCRVRRRHAVRITNHKGFFARWLPRLVPEMRMRRPRGSRFDCFMAEWKSDNV